MAYYRGDYYRGDRGDYYRGDPFLGAIVGGIARKVGLGKLAAKAGRWALARVGVGGVRKAAAAAGAVAATTAIATGVQGVITRRDKYGGELETPEESWERRQAFGFRRRKMNPLNPKALNRALRRAQGFEKFARKTVNALYKTVDGRKVKTFKKKGR